ncbi:cell division protein ZapE [Glutamicibacter sp.]|uniref:cell division protein ZapE n=1 Tax=Glutamicibacter sp. TaxID=1931995 RepID=UPI0028BEB71A|nr:cell division protein ZapE [Glutamicibacter sp.]
MAEKLAIKQISPDPAQRCLIQLLDNALGRGRKCSTQGIYVYGPPGRGKTVVINALVELLPEHATARFHFHEFFHHLNSPKNRVPGERLGSIFTRGLERELQGLKVLIFDEFHCTEPGDAMLMAKLVKYCSQQSIFMVTTSNYSPELLLDDEAFHHLVQPTIATIHNTFEVFELDHQVDYRTLPSTGDAKASGFRAGSLALDRIPDLPQVAPLQVSIGYDHIGSAHILNDAIWIDFAQLCGTRRNTVDYLELSQRYAVWHIMNIPRSAEIPMDEERRFANLLDIFYDRDMQLHLYARDNLERLGHMLHKTEKDRLVSRLAELTYSHPERTN